MKLFWTNNIYRQLLLNSCFSSFGDSIFYLAIINYVAQYNFAPLAILLISISEMVPLLSQLFLGILGDFQENRVKHALWIAKIKILLYAILTVFLVLSPFSLVSVIMIVIINLISDTLSYLSAYMMNALYISVIKDDLHDGHGVQAVSDEGCPYCRQSGWRIPYQCYKYSNYFPYQHSDFCHCLFGPVCYSTYLV